MRKHFGKYCICWKNTIFVKRISLKKINIFKTNTAILKDFFTEWIQNDEQQNSELTKQRNNKTAKLQNSEEQNSDHNKSANVTKERTFVKNGELTIQNMDNFLLGKFAVFLEVKM